MKSGLQLVVTSNSTMDLSLIVFSTSHKQNHTQGLEVEAIDRLESIQDQT